jgi:hypothetical protein
VGEFREDDAPKAKEPTCSWAAGPEPKHLADFRQVYWPELGTFTFLPKQARVVELLWEAREDGAPHVPQADLLAGADSDSSRLLDLFRSNAKSHPAWGRLIVPGDLPATFRLAPLPGEQEEEQTT